MSSNGEVTHEGRDACPFATGRQEVGGVRNDERILGLLHDRWIDYPRAAQALQ